MKIIFTILLFPFVVSACGINDNMPTPVETSTNSPVPLEIYPSKTPTITLTPKPTNTPTSTSYPTQIPTRILTDLVWTPLPTIPPEDALVYVKDLVNENLDCVLPCWMGITPGKTTLNEAWHILSPFATNLFILNKTFVMLFQFEKDENIVLVPPTSQSGPILILVAQFEFENEIINFIYPEIYGAKDRYSLKTVLNTYGKPSEIWFHAGALSKWTANIGLFYGDIGISVIYRSTVEDSPENDILEFCFQEFSGSAKLWSPALNFTLQDLYPDSRYGNVLTFEEVSGLTIDEFYNTFKEVDEACIQTSREMLLDAIKKFCPTCPFP